MHLTMVTRCSVNAIAKFADLADSFSSIPTRPFAIALAATSAAALAGCAQQPGPQRMANSKEYFPASIYGPASPRVVADGEPIPHGGGTYLVGKPYTVAGRTYYPTEKQYAAVGLASWYGDAFHGRRTANGEIFDRDSLSAAHPTMPLPSYARVTNLRNNYSMIVRVNDRGPYAPGRIMDVSRRVAEALEFRHVGTAKVKVEYLGGASLAGSDDGKLLATLRVDGAPAQFNSVHPPTMVAQQSPSLRTAEAEPVAPPPRRDDAIAAALSDERASAAVATNNIVANNAIASSAPLPPARPFDLGTIPGAAVPITQRMASGAR
jgi:rare lipoprotein A